MEKQTKERRYIIVDDDNRPMTWQEPQLVYVNRKSRFEKVYLETYTEQQAFELIGKSQQLSKKNKYKRINYFLIPMK